MHVNVQEGDRVRAGDPLMDGPSNPHDMLHVLGEKELLHFLRAFFAQGPRTGPWIRMPMTGFPSRVERRIPD